MAATAQDATMRVLDKLNDPTQWDKIEIGIPVFTEHEEECEDENGKKVKLKITTERLHKILDKMIHLERTRGVLPIITEGHRVVGIKGYPESRQPDVLGVLANARIETFGKEKTPAIVGDAHYLPGKYEKAKGYPFRSAEIYLTELTPSTPYPDEFTAVALLKKDPRLNMGLVMNERRATVGHFERSSSAYCFSIGEPMEPVHDVDGEFEGHFSKCMAKKYPHFERFYGEGTKHFALDTAGLHAPGAGNVVPLAAVGEETEKKEEPKPPHMMERDAVLAQFEKRLSEAESTNTKLTARLVQVEEERAQLKRENTFVTFERDLNELRDVEGFDIDVASELKDAKEDGLKPEQFTKKLDWFRRNARKLPVAHFGRQTGPSVYTGHVEGATNGAKAKPITPKMVNDAAIGAKAGEDVATAFERINGFPMR